MHNLFFNTSVLCKLPRKQLCKTEYIYLPCTINNNALTIAVQGSVAFYIQYTRVRVYGIYTSQQDIYYILYARIRTYSYSCPIAYCNMQLCTIRGFNNFQYSMVISPHFRKNIPNLRLRTKGPFQLLWCSLQLHATRYILLLVVIAE